MIELHNIWKSFSGQQVLCGINRVFETGQIHGIVGNNGSGKTVMMKCICGFLYPDSGHVLVDGKRVGTDMDFPKNIGAIIETPGFLSGLTGLKNLKLLASLQRKINEEDIRAALRRVDLDPDLKKPVSKYSLGMRQRLGIAQAIMEDPAILILDEPFNGLDKHGVADMRELILSLRDEGKTILLASHNQADIDMLSDTVCKMDDGKMIMLRNSRTEKKDQNNRCKNQAFGNDRILVEELTLIENAALPLAVRGVSRAERNCKAEEILKRLGAGRILHARPSMVTPAQRQMVLDAQTYLLNLWMEEDEGRGVMTAHGSDEQNILNRLEGEEEG